MESSKDFRILIVAPGGGAGGASFETMLDKLKPHMQLASHFDLVQSPEQYQQLADCYSYDLLVVQFGGPFMHQVLNAQATESSRLKWVHSLTAGIDAYVPARDFVKSKIPLTNVKGAFSAVLGEFVALGMLWHAKNVTKFRQNQQARIWQAESIELVSNKVMAIIGYGNIGAHCAKAVKALGTRVIGVKRRPQDCDEFQRQNADEIVGLDKVDAVLSQADFVVGILPKTDHTYHFFDASFFAKMKKSAVFMNIGRGPTCKEDDLCSALSQKIIAGAVLDVFEVEPLPKESPLWEFENVLMTPHCADVDSGYLDRACAILGENINRFLTGKELMNVCDKEAGY